MSRFLVTGGAGFIGSHITEELARRKHLVRVLDNFSSGKKENLKNLAGKVEIMRGDIRDRSTCLSAAKGIDHVLHQAALRSVPKSLVDPASYNEVNVGGTLNMLEAAKANKVRSFVFASSSSIYGDVTVFPEKEDALSRLISPYALSKLAGEYYCKIFSHHYGLPTACLRYFNVFGPRQALDDEYAVVIPKFIHCIMHDQQPPIFGTGKQSRDFTFVKNVVNANLLAARNMRLRGEVFNVASGKDYTILKLAQILNSILGKNIRPKLLPIRPGDVFKTLADLTRSKKMLGYRPAVDFVEGLRQTVEYFRGEYA
jgi:nucleoside-diphosphate-sugar epimerase